MLSLDFRNAPEAPYPASLQDINLREGLTVVTNLHTLDTARTYCDRIVAMRDGKVLIDGWARQLNSRIVHDLYGSEDMPEIDEEVTSTAVRELVTA